MSGWSKRRLLPSTGTTSPSWPSKRLLLGSLVSLLLCLSAAASAESQRVKYDATPYIERQNVRDFIIDVAERHDLNKHTLAGWFSRLTPQTHILKAISKPAERTLSWREYRPIFLGDERISSGQAFMQEHAGTLTRAEHKFGVPAEIITAIIGVETFYGKHTGKHGALESLATLAFDYPPRSKFFTNELEEYILLVLEEGWDPLERRGSYAAAMGYPQFISSSYRAYAVDFDGDGRRDLINSIDDAIGSVGHYLARHGWQRDAPITARWKTSNANHAAATGLVRKSLKPSIPVAELKKLGFDAAGTQPVSVMRLKAKSGTQTWVGYKNFYAITRYNHSRLYAMAVTQLAQQLKVSE